MSRVVVKPYSTGTGPVGMPPKIRDGQRIFVAGSPRTPREYPMVISHV